MSNTGTSYKFIITNQPLQASFTPSIQRYNLQTTNPPVSTSYQGQPSYAITKWINPFPQIAFEKIVLPQFESVYQYTTRISNQPDYIKDYHFIALMRCIDFYNAPAYQALIKGDVDGIFFR